MHDSINLCKSLKVETCSDIVNKLDIADLVTDTSRLPDHCLMTMKLEVSYSSLVEDNSVPDDSLKKNKVSFRNRIIPSEFLQSDVVKSALLKIINDIGKHRII